MKNQSLIVKYRPRNFGDIVGQKLATEALINAVRRSSKGERVPNMFLFHGSPGVGKTSTANVFTLALNCKDYDYENLKLCEKCNSCQYGGMFTKINCAKMGTNMGILNEYMRRMLNNPDSLFNAFLFDEAHDLKPTLQDALHEKLDELPGTTLVIFSTSKPDNLETAFRKRPLNIEFPDPSDKSILLALKRILKKENASLSNSTLEKIVNDSCGDIREAINTLDLRLLGE